MCELINTEEMNAHLEYYHTVWVLRKGDKRKIKSNFNLSTRLRFQLARTYLGEISEKFH